MKQSKEIRSNKERKRKSEGLVFDFYVMWKCPSLVKGNGSLFDTLEYPIVLFATGATCLKAKFTFYMDEEKILLVTRLSKRCKVNEDYQSDI